jgi:carbonic anhydrase
MIRIFISSSFLIYYGLFGNSSELSRLLEGNKRFMDGNLLHPNRTLERRKLTVSEQEPFAVVVSCSDSRVSPEIIFDEGIGDLFVVRLAGNVIDSIAKESILYAVHYLHSSIILVLGHENCGAVHAVLQKQIKDIPKIATLISPSIKKIRSSDSKDRLKDAIKANAIGMKNKLTQDKNFKEFIAKDKLQIFPAYYHLKSGEVEILNH